MAKLSDIIYDGILFFIVGILFGILFYCDYLNPNQNLISDLPSSESLKNK